MNPRCRILRGSHGNIPLEEIINTGRFDLDAAESSDAWTEELNVEHIPETEEYGIRSTTFRSRRPFHPKRLYTWLKKPIKGVVRAKGYFWIAPYPELALFLSQAGPQKQIEQAGFWWSAIDQAHWPQEPEYRKQILDVFEGMWGDRRQELVFIGLGIDKEKIEKELTSCLLTDSELKGKDLESIRKEWTEEKNPFETYVQLEELGNTNVSV